LAHNKILTGENLNKRGFSGPFRCALCNISLENSEHLFLNCNFTRQVMNCIYKELIPNVANPTSTRSLLGKWAKQYKGSFKGKQKFSIVWKASIKFVCWQIWLTRNKKIFKEKTIAPQVVATSAISQISEYISSKKMDIKEGAKMRKEEEAWINKFNIRDNSGDHKTNQAPCWQLQYTYHEFINWSNSHKKHVLSFDGASKGNPGEGGVGGAIRNPRGQLMDTYSWNLGIVSNNVAEAYALLKGIQIAKERQIN
jgi:hypothetical protein